VGGRFCTFQPPSSPPPTTLFPSCETLKEFKDDILYQFLCENREEQKYRYLEMTLENLKWEKFKAIIFLPNISGITYKHELTVTKSCTKNARSKLDYPSLNTTGMEQE
jgi:hypothetical protein